jgi:ABC-type antimicrobial peptide transport system permease subunit
VGMLSLFGFLALGLASVGLYGVMAYSINQRRREIGLRMALGAAPGGVIGMVLREGLGLVGVGILLGLLLSLFVAAGLSKLLYGVHASDPLSLSVACGILLLVATIACYIPARRASRIDPAIALREG